MKRNIAAVILAAGLGTRMRSDRAKVLHEIHGIPMVYYVIETARRVIGDDIVLVVGNQANTVKEVVSSKYQVRFALQEKQLGTGHAVQCAIPALPEKTNSVIILCGDVPLIRPETLQGLMAEHEARHSDVTVLAVDMENPDGYGRIVYDKQGNICGIVEQADATEAQRAIRTINTGIYCVQKGFLVNALALLDKDNQQGELYLTDIVRIAHVQGRRIGAMVSNSAEEFIGVNTQEDLQKVTLIMSGNAVGGLPTHGKK